MKFSEKKRYVTLEWPPMNPGSVSVRESVAGLCIHLLSCLHQ